MTPAHFLARVTLDSSIAVVALALVATGLGGTQAGLGVFAGGALGLGSLWWLARGALSMSQANFARARWVVAAAVRFGAISGAAALVLGTGLAHPVALVVGMTVLPCALITEGLRTARPASGE